MGLERLAAPPIFVVGHHRSGTTWVFDLLAYPESVAGVFESWMFTTDQGLGGLLHWGHWESAHVERVETIFGRRAGIGQLVSHDEVIRLCRDIASDFLGRACGPQTRYLVEKSPDHLYAALAISEVFPDARFVNVIRDGRDVAVSVRAASRWNEGDMPRAMRSTRDIARRWRGAMEFSRRMAGELGPRYMDVSYEALHEHTHDQLAALYAFCGIEVDDATIDAAIKASDFETNYEGGEDKFRRAGRTGDWRSAMSLRDRFRFQLGAGSELIRRGYERSRFWWLRKPKI